MAGSDMDIRQNDVIELHPDCREQHLPLWRMAADPGGLLSAGLGLERSHYAIERRRIPHHQLLYTLSGSGWILIDGRRRVARPGQLWICAAGNPQRYGLGRGRHWEIMWLTLDPAAPPWSELLAPRPNELRAARCLTPLRHLLQDLAREGRGERERSVELMQHLCRALVIHLERELSDAAEEDPVDARHRHDLDTVFDLVRQNPAAPWSTELLLHRGHFAIGRDHFTHLCRRIVGETPMQRVAKLRMQHAAELLLCSDYDLETIAGLVGYGSAFAFSNAFHQQQGERPSHYRRRAGR